MIGLAGTSFASQRLHYRLLKQSDKAALALLLSDPEVTAPAGYLPAPNDRAFDDFFASLIRYDTAIALLKGDTLIGYCRVNRYQSDAPELKGKNCVSTGFVIGKAYQLQGYGTEMLQAVTAYLLKRFDACFADCFQDNEASRKTIEKCGYRYVETYPFYFDELAKEKLCLSYVRT